MDLTDEQRAALDALPEKRRAWVLAYVSTAEGNATEAARIAGYKHPNKIGPRLVKVPELIAAVSALRKPRYLAALSTREERLAFYASVFRDESASLKDRLKAAELAGKVGGDFVDRVALSGDDGRPAVRVVISREQALAAARRGNR